MKIYYYDPVTKEYAGEGISDSLPTGATKLVPPNETGCLWNGRAWEVPAAEPVVTVDYTEAEKLTFIRQERDKRLAGCDWTQYSDSPLQGDQAWLAYRSALRDITDTVDVNNPIFPDPPEA